MTTAPTDIEDEIVDAPEIDVEDLVEVLDDEDTSEARALVATEAAGEQALAIVGDPALRRAGDKRLAIIKNLVPDDAIYQIAVTLLRGTGTDASRLIYASDLRTYLGWSHVEGIDPRLSTRDDLINYQDHIKRYKVSSQMRLMSVLRLFYRELEVREMLPGANPTLMLPKIRGKADEQPVGYSEREAKLLLKGIREKADDITEELPVRARAARDYAIVYLALTSGLRASELVALKCGDIHLEQSIYWVVQVRGKGRKDRIVKIPLRTVEIINDYKEAMEGIPVGLTLTDEDPLFVRLGPNADPPYAEPMTTRNLRYIVIQWTAEADLGGKRKAVHQLRRTAATIAHENDAPIDQIGDMLGHADLRTTRDLYIKPADRLRKAASDHINLG